MFFLITMGIRILWQDRHGQQQQRNTRIRLLLSSPLSEVLISVSEVVSLSLSFYLSLSLLLTCLNLHHPSTKHTQICSHTFSLIPIPLNLWFFSLQNLNFTTLGSHLTLRPKITSSEDHTCKYSRIFPSAICLLSPQVNSHGKTPHKEPQIQSSAHSLLFRQGGPASS